MSDLNIYSSGYSNGISARNRCRLYERLPLENSEGRSVMYALSLSPGHTLGDESVGADQTADLLCNLLSVENSRYIFLNNCERVVVQAAPTGDWLRYRNRISEKRLIIKLPDSYKLKPGEDRIMTGLRRSGAQFAMTLGELGDLPKKPELLSYLDYVFIDHRHRSGFLTALNGLKTSNPNLKSIGVKPRGEDFLLKEASYYDLVLGYVEHESIVYEKRPLWQHELIRTLAELFSGIYSLKGISALARKYPDMSRAMTGILNSKKVIELTGKPNNMVTNGQVRLSQKDVTSLMCVCVGYQLLCLAEKTALEAKGQGARYSGRNVELGYFRRALITGKLLESLAEQPCDDYESRHAFMVGFLMLLPEMIRDSRENIENEFMLTAVNSFHSDTTTLGLVCSLIKEIRSHNTEKINELITRSGLVLNKEDYYRLYYRSMIWADEVVNALTSQGV
ncbi:MAG: hypothetical protein PUA61_01105 [Succinatimonas hippei]|nr:hypothetical protein [Succinatimonas hippei]